MIPSENILSKDVLRALASPMAGRYAGRPESYGGSKIFHELWEHCEELVEEVFDCDAASVAPVSGHLAGMMALDSFCKKGDKVGVIEASNGGYKGYNEALIPDVLGLESISLPFDLTNWNIDLEPSLEVLDRYKPSAVVLGGTVFLFPHPVAEIAKAVHSYGGKVIYDGSHVLGLIAGGQFQQPLSEGADVLLGSTHKTLFGPQGGIILSNQKEIVKAIEESYLYRFIDNFHLNRIAALAVALEEVKKHGKAYARNIVQNSRALASEMGNRGLPVVGRSNSFTRSHQVFLDYGEHGDEIRDKLEANRIICDSRVRFGTNEATRRGMGISEMKQIAELVGQSLANDRGRAVSWSVSALVSRFRGIKYTLDN
jgi:glycine hydroxymethyltransferase